jgi:NAD-dependent SIR2 family protein deacetylase
VLKPNVVFFGENVPKERVDAAWELFGEAEVLLVAGSSLTVYSGYRFVLGAAEKSMPVGIVNLGSTRGDEIARVRVHGRTGEVLPVLSETLL